MAFVAPNQTIGKAPTITPVSPDLMNAYVQQNLLTPKGGPNIANAGTPIMDFAGGFGARQAGEDQKLADAYTAAQTKAGQAIDPEALKAQIDASHQSKGIGSDIMAGTQDVGMGALGALTGLAKYATTAEGKNIRAGMEEDPDRAAALLGQSEIAQGQETGLKNLAYESEQQRQKNLQDYAKSQAELTNAQRGLNLTESGQENERTKTGLDIEKAQKENQQKIADYATNLVKTKQVSNIDDATLVAKNALSKNPKAIGRIQGHGFLWGRKELSPEQLASLSGTSNEAVAMK